MPSQFGKLTLSGLLYEGSDLEAWKARVDATLYIHNLADFDSTRALDVSCNSTQGIHTKAAVDLISASVSPHILSRIPTKDRASPGRLWKVISLRAKSFRFLELPDAVRTSIYSLAGWQDVENVEIGTPLPPITAVSRQLRKESRAACLAHHEFYISMQLKPSKANRAEWLEQQIRTWAEKSLGEDAQHLRRLTIPYCYNYRATSSQTQNQVTWLVIRNIMITFSAENGVLIKADPTELHFKNGEPELLDAKVLSNECEEMLRTYQAKVNKDRTTFRLKGGEAIIWAMLGRPELFDDGVMKWCDRKEGYNGAAK